jgi:hypothetical protein
VRRITVSALVFVVALVVIFEEWLWDIFTSLMERISRFKLVTRIERLILNRHPYVIMAMFLIPVITMIPFKLYAAYLIATGKIVKGVVTVVIAKTTGTVIATRLFIISKPKLLTVPFFARFYHWVTGVRDRLKARLHEMPAFQYASSLVKEMKAWVRRRVTAMRAWLPASTGVRPPASVGVRPPASVGVRPPASVGESDSTLPPLRAIMRLVRRWRGRFVKNRK